MKAENRRLQSQISSPSGYVPKVCEQSAITWPTSPSKPSSIAMRLGERLQGNVAASSPSQRLLTRLYGDEIIMKDEVNTPDAVSEDRDEVSTVSWDGSSSSEDDVMSPGCVTEELMSPVGITKDIKKTNDELKYLETKHLNGKEKSICQNGLKSDKEEGADSAKVNGHNPELGQEAEAKKCVQSVKVNGHDPELSGEFSGKKGAVSATVYGHGQELNWESHRDAEGMARYVGGEKKRQSWNLTGENVRNVDITSPLVQSEFHSKMAEYQTKPKSILKPTSKYDRLGTDSLGSVLVPIRSETSPKLASSSNLARSLVLLSPTKYQGPPPPVPPKPILNPKPKRTLSEPFLANYLEVDSGKVIKSGDLLARPPPESEVNSKPEVGVEKLPSGGVLGKLPGVQLGTITECKKLFPWKSNKSPN